MDNLPGDLYVVNASGSDQRRLIFDGSGYPLAWSRDGQKIANETDRDDNQQIYTANIDASEHRRVSFDDANDSDSKS